jgi:hypothetical protein
MKKALLDLTTVQEGHKIQLVKRVREKWGEQKTAPGKRMAFYEDEEGRIILEPLD